MVILKNNGIQFIKFLFVGALNTLFGYGCFALLIYLGLHYTVAMFLATVFGVMFNFKSTGALVFGSKNNNLVFRFVGVYIVTYGINVVAMSVFTSLGISPYIGGAVLLLPMAMLSFILIKRFVFKHG